MKLTKRILTCAMAVILVAAMALSFTACGGDKAVEDVKKVKDAGKIIVGITEYAPMDYKDENGDSPGKNTGVGCHALLQGIFPIQESNPGLLDHGST